MFTRPVAKRTGRHPHLTPVPERTSRTNPLNDLWRTATGITNTVTRTVNGATEIAAGLIRPTAGSSLVGPVTSMRRYRAVRVPLADVEQVCRKFDVTINDVALAAITEGYRSVLLHRGGKNPGRIRCAPGYRICAPVRLHRPAGQPMGSCCPIFRSIGTTRSSSCAPCTPVNPDQAGRTAPSRQHGSMDDRLGPFMLSSWMIRLLTRMPQRGMVDPGNQRPRAPANR